jgi:hypothetical protein
MSNDKFVDKMIHFDPLYQAEKLTGESYKESEGTQALGFAIMRQTSQFKKNMLAGMGDSYYSMPYKDYIRILKRLGFKVVLKYKFTRDKGEESEHQDVETILFHPEGVLVSVDSYTGLSEKTVNGADMYFNWQPNTDDVGILAMCRSSGHWKFPKEHEDDWDWFDPLQCVWIGHTDIREAVVHKFNLLKKHGTLIRPWVAKQHLWLVDGEQTKMVQEGDGKYSYDQFTEETKAKLPKKVRDVITVKEE